MAEGELTFIQATTADHPRVLAQTRSRAEWLRGRGSTQWSVFLSENADRFVAELIATGLTYLVTLDGHDVGTLRLQWTDRTYWGDAGVDGQAGYVHTLAVHPDFAGRGFGARMLGWACRQIAANGRPLLRIDCAASNSRLIAHYQSLGFQKRAVITVPVEAAYLAQQLERRVDKPFE